MPARDVRSRLGIDGEARVVTCVSRLSHEKGIDVLLRAAAKMHERAAQFFIVGDGPRRGDLVELARELGVEERVTFVGMKPHEEVPLWIAAGDVLALPSRIEGHPNAVLEALACGRPVVGTRVGGVAEAIRSEAVGMLVESESPEGMARALDEALAREWDTEAIAAVGGARTWDHVAGELLDLVSAVTGENS
jgi:glycosyltransferase involved in cell wall biosynthesis